MNNLIRHLRTLSLGTGRSDGQLLGDFVERREEAAFAALVHRHGPMVFGVCRRLLGNLHDAEDAFQATFLVLVRKARRIRADDTIGNWLYGVACRTALRVRAMNAKRRSKEQQTPLRLFEPSPVANEWEDVRQLLDEELSRLPDKLRAPVVLCDLEGKSRIEAARLLSWPVGTLSWRLDAARKTLAARLTRRGVALGTGSVLALLSQQASACVPGTLAAATTRAALALAAAPSVATVGLISAKVLTLTEGVMKSMFLAKLTSVPAVFVGVAALGLTTGGLFYQSQAGTEEPTEPREAKAAAAQPPRDPPGRRSPEAEPRGDDVRRALEEAKRRERQLSDEIAVLKKSVSDLQRELERREQMKRADRPTFGFQGPGPADPLQQRKRPPQGEPPRDQPLDRFEQREPRPGGPVGPDGAPRPREPRPAGPPGPGRPGAGGIAGPGGPSRTRDLEPEESAALSWIEERRRALAEEMKRLDEQEHQIRDRVAQRRTEQMRQQGGGRRGFSSGPFQGDRLEELIQRLERIERRLQQLEQNRPGPGPRREGGRPGDPTAGSEDPNLRTRTTR